MKRRDFLKGLSGCIAAAQAPAFVRAGSLMNIYVPPEPKILSRAVDGDVYTSFVTFGEISDPDIRQFGGSIEIRSSANPANNGLYQVVDVSDGYESIEDRDGWRANISARKVIREGGWYEPGDGIVIDAEGRTTAELYEEIKRRTRILSLDKKLKIS